MRAILLIACAKSRTRPMLAITTITGAISGQTASCGCCLSLAESLAYSTAASIQKAQLKQFHYCWQLWNSFRRANEASPIEFILASRVSPYSQWLFKFAVSVNRPLHRLLPIAHSANHRQPFYDMTCSPLLWQLITCVLPTITCAVSNRCGRFCCCRRLNAAV